MKPTERQITNAKKVLKAAGYIDGLFHKDDVRSVAEDREITLTDAEVDMVAERLEWIDANLGINWETIDIMIDDVLAERKV